jgi:hypothetical protein
MSDHLLLEYSPVFGQYSRAKMVRVLQVFQLTLYEARTALPSLSIKAIRTYPYTISKILGTSLS